MYTEKMTAAEQQAIVQQRAMLQNQANLGGFIENRLSRFRSILQRSNGDDPSHPPPRSNIRMHGRARTTGATGMNEQEARWYIRGQIVTRYKTLKSYAKAKGISCAAVSKRLNTSALSAEFLAEFGLEISYMPVKKESP